MEKITVLLADDEPGMRMILRKKIEQTEGFTVVGEAADGRETMADFEALSPQVVFLDVDMPLLSGTECARLMQDMDPTAVLIFATGHEEYRQEAFDVYAFDYLVKPFKMERLEQTLNRIESRLRGTAREQSLPTPRPAARKLLPGRMMLKHKDGVTFLDMNDILLVQREERATVLYTAGGGRYVLPETLSETEARLDPETFFRCHKSYIINLQKVRDITPYGRWTYVVRLEGTEHDALITHEKYEELEKRFGS